MSCVHCSPVLLYIVICIQLWMIVSLLSFFFQLYDCITDLCNTFGIGIGLVTTMELTNLFTHICILTTLYYLLSLFFFIKKKFIYNYLTKHVHALSAFLIWKVITLVTCKFHKYCQSIFGQCESKIKVHVNNSGQWGSN